MNTKHNLHLAILAKLNAEGILKDLKFDRLTIFEKNLIHTTAMSLPEDKVEAYYRNLAATAKRIGFNR